ncbi:MAG: sugar ABC transporter substrate-binding protein [Clostridia bacterium]|nr:sugar ABC transporter substrate-binding protein [Clostridia bacterium]
MRKPKITTILLIMSIAMSMTGCNDNSGKENEPTNSTTLYIDDYNWDFKFVGGPEYTEFSAYVSLYSNIVTPIGNDNEIQEKIADRTNCIINDVVYADASAGDDALVEMIDNDNLTDFVVDVDFLSLESRSNSTFLGEDGMLVPWDEYIEEYPNLKELYTDEEWDSFRYEDGHIYWADIFGRVYGEDRNPKHEDFAFWVQARVLEWDGYPEINTLDEYFDLLMRYADANPTMPDGTEVIPYTALCEDWRFFCIESAPLFLDGYADNGGSVIVNEDDPDNLYVMDYNVTPTAKLYFQKLNEIYNAGYMDEDFDTQTYEEYIAKLSTGRVLGMADQYWDFAYTIDPVFEELGLKEMGCDYVPLALVMEEGQSSHYHLYSDPTYSPYGGLAVTTKCSDPDKAFEFLNDLLDQEIHDLRFWGIEGEDYLVDENGYKYRIEDMREFWSDTSYQEWHCCQYPFLPNWYGTSRDGFNAMRPEEQASEIYASVSEPLARCFKAYGASGYADMLKSDKDYRIGDWAPLFEYSSVNDDPADIAWRAMSECKHEWIPTIVKSSNFESSWKQYMNAYNNCNPQDYLDYKQALLDERLGK